MSRASLPSAPTNDARLYAILRRSPLTVEEIRARLDAKWSSTILQRHLRRLRQAGRVVRESIGGEIRYRVVVGPS